MITPDANAFHKHTAAKGNYSIKAAREGSIILRLERIIRTREQTANSNGKVISQNMFKQRHFKTRCF